MNIFLKALIVAGIAVLELWGAIPMGFVLNLHPIVIACATIIGGLATPIIVIAVGGKVKEFIYKKKERKFSQLSIGEQDRIKQREVEKQNKRHNRIYRIWEKYGIIGLGLLAPLLVGAFIGSTIAVSLGVDSKRIVLWIGLGVVLWTVLLVVLASLGVSFAFKH